MTPSVETLARIQKYGAIFVPPSRLMRPKEKKGVPEACRERERNFSGRPSIGDRVFVPGK